MSKIYGPVPIGCSPYVVLLYESDGTIPTYLKSYMNVDLGSTKSNSTHVEFFAVAFSIFVKSKSDSVSLAVLNVNATSSALNVELSENLTSSLRLTVQVFPSLLIE